MKRSKCFSFLFILNSTLQCVNYITNSYKYIIIIAIINTPLSMTQKNKKQFGVWMDTHQATVVGRANADTENFTVLAVAGNAGAEHNTSEKNQHNDERTLQNKFFKEILSHMQNAEEVHLTGTGTSQEQLMRYMAAVSYTHLTLP